MSRDRRLRYAADETSKAFTSHTGLAETAVHVHPRDDLPLSAKAVASALACYFHPRANGIEVYPSYATLRERTGIATNKTIAYALRCLQRKRLIEVSKFRARDGMCERNCYRLLWLVDAYADWKRSRR